MKDGYPVLRNHRLELWPFRILSGGARCVVTSVPGMSRQILVPSARQARTASRGSSELPDNDYSYVTIYCYAVAGLYQGCYIGNTGHVG
jgi:hypothetical protein